jgi:uncharacterized membrane protein YheB (UPF0754 family)
MISDSLLQGLVTIGVGAVSGGITNAVAIWMLFHPHKSRGIGPFRLQGAIPKNKARLARSIGKTVGERLLTPEDIGRRLQEPKVRGAFTDAVGGVLDRLLEQERGTLEQELPSDIYAMVQRFVDDLGPKAADRVATWAESAEFAGLLDGFLDRLEADIGEKPLSESLTDERRGMISGSVRRWVADLAEHDELEATLRSFVADRMERMAGDDTPLLDRLPPGLVGAVESAITDYLPMALERLGDLLGDPVARSKVEFALREAFDHSIRDLLLHERILAKLVVTDRTIERLVDGFEAEGFDRFAEALTEPGMKAQVTRAVNDAVDNFLRQPLGARLRNLGPAKFDALETTLADWLVRVARDPATRDALARAADRLLTVVERRTWGDVLRVIPRERATGMMRDALRGERGRAAIADVTGQLTNRLLARPIGRPARWFGDEGAAQLKKGLVDAAWGWVEGEVPRVVQQLDVQEMVEQKVLGFSTERMEEIVRNVTQRELTLIVQLGYVLGAIVGTVAFGINLLFE